MECFHELRRACYWDLHKLCHYLGLLMREPHPLLEVRWITLCYCCSPAPPSQTQRRGGGGRTARETLRPISTSHYGRVVRSRGGLELSQIPRRQILLQAVPGGSTWHHAEEREVLKAGPGESSWKQVLEQDLRSWPCLPPKIAITSGQK